MTQEIIEMVRQVGLDWHKGWTLEEGESNMFEAFAKLVAAKKRNDTLEEVAQEFDKMKVFGDTAASFAIFVREMKS